MEVSEEDKAPYATSSDAYRAIHEALAWGVSAHLDDALYADAIRLAEMMREIEGHTDVE